MSVQPILIVMAAGLGSRYGGLKQIAPVDTRGHILTDYALYDAKRAGFERVVFVISESLEKEFRDVIGDRISKHMEVRYAFQKSGNLPEGIIMPEGRAKPWGTAHALLSAKHLTNTNFAAINADDFYGASAFRSMYDFLRGNENNTQNAMVSYAVGNTVTEHGFVARGVCECDGERLLSITERTRIEKRPYGAAFTEDGKHYSDLPFDTPVSMNLWGFSPSMMDEIESRFAPWLRESLSINPLSCEYGIPTVVNGMLKDKTAAFAMLPSQDRWFGVTYANDMPTVQSALFELRALGQYPETLWEE